MKRYYNVSAPMVEFITGHPSLKLIVRLGLFSIVAIIDLAVKTTPVEETAIIGLSALVLVVKFQLFHIR